MTVGRDDVQRQLEVIHRLESQAEAKPTGWQDTIKGGFLLRGVDSAQHQLVLVLGLVVLLAWLVQWL